MTDRFPCPVCDAPIPWDGPGSEDGLGPLTSELRRICLGPDPIAAAAALCTGCGFASTAARIRDGNTGVHDIALDPLFNMLEPEQRGPADETVAERIRRLLSGHAHAAPVAAAWEHTAWIASWRGDGPLAAGDAWLRAAWMNDDAKQRADAERCRRRALGCYEGALAVPETFRRRADRAVVNFLAGELNRRIGNQGRAEPHFLAALGAIGTDPKLRSLRAVVERQMSDPVLILEGR